MNRKRELIESAAICICFALIVALLTSAGFAHRRYLRTSRVLRISAPHEAYAIWTEQNVRGRILFLFDRQLNATEKNGPPQSDNYVFLSIQKGLIRKIYHVIPDVFWPDVSRSLQKNPFAAGSGDGFRMNVHEGVPVIIIRMKDLPRIKEQALVSINTGYWTDSGLGQILERLRTGTVRSDLVTVSGRMAESDLKGVRDAFE